MAVTARSIANPRADRKSPRSTQSAVTGSRRLVIRQRGVEPARMHGKVSENPARGKAQGRIALRGRTCAGESDRRRESKPRSRRQLIPGRSLLQISLFSTGDRSPRRKSIGAEERARTTGGPGPAEMSRKLKCGDLQSTFQPRRSRRAKRSERSARPPGCGIKPAKGTNPRSAVGR
jgi:hypothetical protein